MDETTKVLALVFMPIVLVVFGLGIYKHITNITINNNIEKRTNSFISTPVTVEKYIIVENFKQRAIKGPERNSVPGARSYTLQFQSYLLVYYNVNGKSYQSFGKFAEFKNIEDVLAHYEILPNRPPMVYYQLYSRPHYTRDSILPKLKNYHPNPPENTSPLLIKCSRDYPEINQLVTTDKRPVSGVYFIYALGVFILTFYFIFVRLAKIGNIALQPVYITFGILLLFVFFMVYQSSISKKSIDAEPLPEPVMELNIF